MRDIKFRAWHKKTLKMSRIFNCSGRPAFDSEYNGEKCTTTTRPSTWIEDCSENETLIYMQYTGLKDKNGVEIYEFMEIDDNFEVSFRDSCYILTNISNGDIVLLYNYWRDKNGQIEVTKEYSKV